MERHLGRPSPTHRDHRLRIVGRPLDIEVSCLGSRGQTGDSDRPFVALGNVLGGEAGESRTMPTPQEIMTSSPDNEEVAHFTEEVLKCLKEMSKNKAPGPGEITSDVFLLGGEAIITYLTKVYSKILQTKEVPPS
ncbi:hypothetical protein ElyMa_007033600 [Elysia marginata]|uniref:Uncharacterized protein n=1 Tax=Elysia marginata TaxID=1093978 RepID=A0AAV4JXR0_9GAST|nr:hypothetical protein ElyMa_007033600 [Elysia marginata]